MAALPLLLPILSLQQQINSTLKAPGGPVSWGTGIRTKMAKTAPPPFLLYLLLVLSFHLLVLFQKQWAEYEHPWVRAATSPPAQRGPSTLIWGARLGSEPALPAVSTGTHIRQASLLQRGLMKSSALWTVRHIRA